MPRRLPQPGPLVLVVVLALAGTASAQDCAREAPAAPSWLRAAPGESDRPALQQPGLPAPAALTEPRGGHPRGQWRDPAPRAWLASPAALPGGWSPSCDPRPGATPPGPPRLRLHVLLCTWLT